MVESPDGQNPQPESQKGQSVERNNRSELDDPASDAGSNPEARKPRVARTMLDISHISKKAGRKLPKTLIDHELPGAGKAGENSQSADKQEVAKPTIAPRTVKRISRTMLEVDVQSLLEQADRQAKANGSTDVESSPNRLDAEPTVEFRTKGVQPTRYVARTMLDHSMLFQAVSHSADRMEHKASELAKERALEPIELIEPIVPNGKVNKCQWKWADSFNAKERYRACEICKAAVYDFTGMEREQAEALIFQRENLKKPKLYQRSDGKFMTRECPKTVARRVQMVTLVALISMTLLSAIMVMILMGQSSKIQPVSVSTDTERGSTAATGARTNSTAIEGDSSDSSVPSHAIPSVTSNSLPPGMFHYENGKITRGPVSPAAQQSSQSSSAPVAAPAASDDEGWQDTSK